MSLTKQAKAADYHQGRRLEAWENGEPCPYCEHEREHCEHGKQGCTEAFKTS